MGQQATLTQSVQKGVFSQDHHAHNGGHAPHGQARRAMSIQATAYTLACHAQSDLAQAVLDQADHA